MAPRGSYPLLGMSCNDARCAVCSVTVAAMGARVCPTCGVMYHRDCWDWIGTCSIFGCNGGGAVRRAVKLRPGYWAQPRPPAFSLRRFFAHNAVVMVLPVVLGAVFYLSMVRPRLFEVHGDYMFAFFAASFLYCVFGPLVDSRHPFSYSQRRSENAFLKSRIIVSGVLAYYHPMLWCAVVATQVVMAVVTPSLPWREPSV